MRGEKPAKDGAPAISLFGMITVISAAVAGAFIYYCEKLQLLPLTRKGLTGRLVIATFPSAAVSGLLFFLLRKTIQTITKKDWLAFLLAAFTASVCAAVWFPIPNTGLYSEHHLSVRVIPDQNGDTHPVTLSWLHHDGQDAALDSIQCEGNCTHDAVGVTLPDEQARLNWHGRTGNQITVEFVSDENQGIAEITLDSVQSLRPLNNTEMNRLSFDFSVPSSDGLPEFIAVWWLIFLLCLCGIIALAKLLPGWDIKIFGCVIFVIFAAFRIIQFRTVTGPLSFIDSEFYLGLSRFSVSDILSGKPYCRTEWHCLARPVLVPLVYKLCRQDVQTITITQMAISTLSWGYFMSRAAKLCRTDIRKKAVMILSLGLGCIPNVTRWDTMIMSESLSISASVLFLGSLFWLTDASGKKWGTAPAVCCALSALLFSVSRDSAVWSVIPVIIVLLIIMRSREKQLIPLVLCGVLAVLCLVHLSNTGDRWVYSFQNVLFSRILRDPQGEAFLKESGMPFPPYIEQLYGTEHLMASALYNSEEYEPLRNWILENGLKTYIRYMLKNPVKTMRMTWYEGFESYAFEKTDYTYTPFGFKQLLPDPVVKFFSCNLPGVLLIGVSIAGIFAAFGTSGGERYAFPVLFILSAYLLCTAAFAADSYELDRHMMAIIIMLKASAWPLMCMLSEDLDCPHG